MEPLILEEKSFQMLGCVFYGDPFHSAKEWSYENEIGNLWQRFGKLAHKYKILLEKIMVNQNVGYELHIEPADYDLKRKFNVYVGIEVKGFEFLPLEMFVKILPKTKYLFFTTGYKGEECESIFSSWLPKSDFEQSYPYIMQSYSPERWNSLNPHDPKNKMDWYIPIMEKGGKM